MRSRETRDEVECDVGLGLEGMGSGCKSPMRAPEEVLFLAQTAHASMYSLTPTSMDGHQNRWEMTNTVLLTPR